MTERANICHNIAYHLQRHVRNEADLRADLKVSAKVQDKGLISVWHPVIESAFSRVNFYIALIIKEGK